MIRIVGTAALALAACVLAGCTGDTGDSGAESTFASVAADYPHALPEGASYPDDLSDPAHVGQWWWCSTINAAWTEYFSESNEAAVLALLAEAEDNQVAFVDYRFGADGHDQAIHYIDGGVDSAWLEGVNRQCESWAGSTGTDHELSISN